MTPAAQGRGASLGPSEGQEARKLRAVDGGELGSALSGADRSRGYLPYELTSFVGREGELAEITDLLLDGTRLLTLAGPGGSGKTRLALAAVSGMTEDFGGGLWWIELAPLSDPDLVPREVASVLGVRDAPGRSTAEALADHIGGARSLLVLDNCEHLVEACAVLAESLLRSCPDLRILATSREVLGAAGEVSWSVPPLSLPDPRRPLSSETLADYESARLFVERARAVKPGFALDGRSAAAVTRICYRLDGMPLAIELAAARTRVLSVEQISERLEDSLGLLTGGGRTAEPRQRTLRATLQWSYDLLSEAERRLLARLSVFAGGWTLDAAEGVGAGSGVKEGDVLDLLSQLIDKSLVLVEANENGELRYGMLEPVRQYGREKLRESTEAPEVRRRHAEHYLDLAEAAEPQLLGADQGRWLRRLRTESGNLREAHSWSAEPGRERERARLRLRLVAALWRFWDVQGFGEGTRWLQAALEKDLGGSPSVRAKALGGLGWILLFQGKYGPAIAVLEEAVALHKELGDLPGTVVALGNIGHAVVHGGYRERAQDFVEEAESLLRGDLDRNLRAQLDIATALAAMEEGDLGSAVARLEESLGLCRELGNMRDAAIALFILGMIELGRDDLDRGAAMLEESAQISRELGDRPSGVYCVWGLGRVAALRGRPRLAAKLWGAAEALREHIGTPLSRFDLAYSGYERDLATVRSKQDGASFEAAWAEGRAITLEDALACALSEEEEPQSASPAMPMASSTRPAGLSEREAEVLGLVARGLTNAQVANELFISPRTVNRHLNSVYRKLGVSSRAAAARVAVEHDLT